VAVVDTVSLEAIISTIPFGLAVVNSARRIVLMNAAFHASLGLDPGRFSPGTKVEDVVRAVALRGGYGSGDPEAQVRAVLAADRGRQVRQRRRTFGGRSFDIFNTPLSDGSYILSSVEITEALAARADAESALGQTVTSLATLRIGVAIFDSRGGMLHSNPRFAELTGLPPERLTPGFPFSHMLSLMGTGEDYGDQHAASLSGAGRRKQRTSLRHRGTGQLVDVIYDPLPAGGWAVSVSDITPLTKAEDESQRRARLLDSVLRAVPHGICVYGPDRRVAMFNQTYLDVMAGAPLDIGDHLADIVRRRAEAGEYCGGEPDEIFAQQVGRPQMRRRTRANGTAIDVRTAPLPDGGHISVVTDVTALVHAEAESGQRAEEMSVMLNSIRHGIMLWSADNRLVASNPMAGQMFDFPPDLLIAGRTESEVVDTMLCQGHLGTGERAVAEAQAMLRRDRSIPDEREMRTVSGRVLAVQSNPVPAGGWVSTVVDITKAQSSEAELRQAKQVAEAANKAKSRFLATMSHELRTPLNAIIGFSDALSRDTARCTVEDIVEYGDQINAAGKQLLSMINTILDVARLETGRFEPGEEAIDVPKVLRRAVRQAESAALAAELLLTLEAPDDLPQLRADERRLLRVLSQLLSNAIKFTEAGGCVTVGAGLATNGDLWLRVADTGIGIEQTELERVFEPFTQLDDSLARRYGGAGLGLYTARAIVNAQGGHIRLTSRLGAGTTAEIIMPGRRLVHESRGRSS
jgi:signal transduction histidine kinase